MAYYGPMELRDANGQPAGKWHYCCSNSAGTFALGSCSGVKACVTCSEKHAYPADPDCAECHGKGLLDVENPCPGHDTAAGATEHYHQFLADNVKWAEKKGEWPKEKCDAAGCNEEGRHHTMMPERWNDALFCATHKTRDAVFAHLRARYEKTADKT